MTKRLSESIDESSADILLDQDWSDRARALEERVAELEGQMREAGSMVIAATERDHAATARAEELEQQRRVLANQRDVIIEQNNRSVARAKAAEAEVARLRRERNQAAELGVGYAAERDALRAKLEKVRAELYLPRTREAAKHSYLGLHRDDASEAVVELADTILAILDGEGDDE